MSKFGPLDDCVVMKVDIFVLHLKFYCFTLKGLNVNCYISSDL